MVAGLAIVAVLAAVITAVAVTGGSETPDGPSAAEVVLAPVTSVGNDPFTQPVTPPVVELQRAGLGGLDVPAGQTPTVSLPALKLPETTPGQVPAVTGNAPGLYGGTNLLSVCDVRKMVDFLKANADKAKAWAEVLGIEVDAIDTYVAGLTDVILQADTRVTNHGFREGAAKALNAVLQKGTAVLVDRFGVPKVRCKCGNPLKQAKPLAKQVKVSGTAWPGFALDTAVSIVAGSEPIKEFALDDLTSDGGLFRLPGQPAADAATTPQIPDTSAPDTTTGGDTTAVATTEPPASTGPTTTTGASSTAGAIRDVTSTGQAQASSIYSAQYDTRFGVDGDPATSWFSRGPSVDGAASRFTWTAQAPILIERIEVLSNATNSDASVRTGFGFGAVEVQVLDAAGKVVFTQEVALPGTPDPNVAVSPGVTGRQVVLLLKGHEAPDCGGFADLKVTARE
jgi:hypothetical protein